MEAPNSIPSVLEQLTRQEAKVLQFVAEGLTYQEIAAQLSISASTVKTHRQNICQKAAVKGVAEIRKFVREAAKHLKNTPFLLLLYALCRIVAMI